MNIRWNQGLKGASNGERQALLEAEAKAERVYAQEVAGRLCAASDLGLADCSGLVVACRTRRWSRIQGSLLSTIECVAAHPAGSRRFNWRLPRVPGTKPVTRTAAIR